MRDQRKVGFKGEYLLNGPDADLKPEKKISYIVCRFGRVTSESEVSEDEIKLFEEVLSQAKEKREIRLNNLNN